jgi:replication-associated recombination protein RarA
MIVNKLFWQKYRPKNVDGMILLPRIKKELINEEGELIINGNYLFNGGPGTGKSSLAELIIPKGSLVINASYNSSVEDLKETVTDYCKQVGNNIFDEDYNPNEKQWKFVYLNEFDGVSQKYQEALKAFIEEHVDRVRFIATCNNINKLSDEILSRFNVINFDPENAKERDYLLEEYKERAKLVIDKNKINLSEHQLNNLIKISFPDLRTILNQLQRISMASEKSTIEESIKGLNIDFFNLIFDKQTPELTYNWVMSNYGDKVEPLLKLCGRYLAEYIMQYKPEMNNKIPKIMPIVTNYSNQLQNTIDPVVLVLACIYNIQEIIQNK